MKNHRKNQRVRTSAPDISFKVFIVLLTPILFMIYMIAVGVPAL